MFSYSRFRNRRNTMRALLPLLLGASCILAHAYRYQRKTFTPRVEALLANLTVQQQIGQMSQV